MFYAVRIKNIFFRGKIFEIVRIHKKTCNLMISGYKL